MAQSLINGHHRVNGGRVIGTPVALAFDGKYHHSTSLSASLPIGIQCRPSTPAAGLSFSSSCGFPFLVKVAAGKINAVTGEAWADEPCWKPQDYLVVPGQPWLDGYCVEDDEIRQFVAMPLGDGYTAEEQLTKQAEHGGMQILVHPLKGEEWQGKHSNIMERFSPLICCSQILSDETSMGLAAGGRMKQKIYEDSFKSSDWDLDHHSRCFVHLTNSVAWETITGEAPPTMPPTAKDYTRAGMPWFDLYDEGTKSLPGSKTLRKVKSVSEMDGQKGMSSLPENESVDPGVVLPAKGMKNLVREGDF